MKKEKQKRILFFLLFAAAAIFLLAVLLDDTKSIAVNKQQSVQDKVDTHLQLTNRSIEELESLRRFEMSHLPEVGDSLFTKSNTAEAEKLDFSHDSNEMNVRQDLDNRSKDFSRYYSPEAKIRNELKQQELKTEYTQEFMQEYAKEFIDNARRGGYIVEVDDNFVVKSVKKAPVPVHKLQLSNPGVSGSK